MPHCVQLSFKSTLLFFFFQKELKDLFDYRDLYFEKNPIELASEKNKLVNEKKETLIEKFEEIDG